MPFTLSHAAAVLPAVRGDGTGRGRLTPALLVAGSFAPDMTYYAASVVPGAMEFGTVTHSFAGVFTVDVLTAWVLVAAWLLVREPLVALLPPARQGRWAALTRCGAPRARVRPASLMWWYVSAALGALTHVVWDAFTHFDRWGMRVFPVLGRPLAGAPLYWYLQYGGSAVAAVVIVAFVVRVLRRTPAGEPRGVPVLSSRGRWRAAAVIGGCAGAGAVRRVALWWGGRGPSADVRDLVPVLCFGAGSGLVVGLLAYAAGVRVWRPAVRVRDGGGAGAAGDGPDAAGVAAGRSAGPRPEAPRRRP
ncbi:DUF4184 family protein [Streptomyces sennicomposti]|uniref:DUF4184 family protein n=1 Tax=Streptomyces sennicomposti TaxID=2873384 RepID=UPI001CA62073|nr:DUF4184 family protein [Streptomyces sennicomposti]MBY8865293.1 DUF4184 family protein [Streptomyces sennicomposti]